MQSCTPRSSRRPTHPAAQKTRSMALAQWSAAKRQSETVRAAAGFEQYVPLSLGVVSVYWFFFFFLFPPSRRACAEGAPRTCFLHESHAESAHGQCVNSGGTKKIKRKKERKGTNNREAIRGVAERGALFRAPPLTKNKKRREEWGQRVNGADRGLARRPAVVCRSTEQYSCLLLLCYRVQRRLGEWEPSLHR